MTDPATPAPRPTLFLSYASEDRTAVRQLRDALETAGLDVWYDESELGGGDAWDAKIRRQIRECDYFMPVISANTERRKEGYFRREWRLAVERTLDMADDVMFLLPVVIDGTTESNARVPEKFLAVQWLRAPAGQPTPALATLARRLAAGEHFAPTPPRGRTEPPISHAAAGTPPPPTPPNAAEPAAEHADPTDGPPRMPAFPKQHEQDLGGTLRFLAEVVWWIISAVWLLLRRAPRWMRLLIVLWAVLSFISYCTRDRSPDRDSEPPRAAKPAKTEKADAPPPTPTLDAERFSAELTEAKKALQASGLPSAFAQFGTDLADRLAAELQRSAATGKHLVGVPFEFGIADVAEAQFVHRVFHVLWGRALLAHPGQAALINTPLASPSDASLVAVGQKLRATYVLGARLTPADAAAGDATPPAAKILHVSLVKVADGSVAWSGEFPLAGTEPDALGARIADALLPGLPTR